MEPSNMELHFKLTEASTCTTAAREMKIKTRISGSIKREQLYVQEEAACDEGLENLFLSNKTNDRHATGHGLKRKAELTKFDEIFIPSKRVSPFLNTPKERKEELKKLLIISVEKLKQLEDPEAFLRKTVLVNNIRKRLQMEFQEENLRTKKYESNINHPVRRQAVINRNYMSNSYLFDDPWLNDDMTETLIDNVFHEKTYVKLLEPDIAEMLGSKGTRNNNSQIDSGLLNSFQSVQNSSDESRLVLTSREECGIVACINYRAGIQKASVDSCDNIMTASRYIVSSCVDNSKSACHDIWQTVQNSKDANKATKFSQITLKQLHNSKYLLLNQARIFTGTDAKCSLTTTETDKRGHSINGLENAWKISSGQRLDKDSTFHSLNKFSSKAKMNQDMPISVPYKVS